MILIGKRRKKERICIGTAVWVFDMGQLAAKIVWIFFADRQNGKKKMKKI